MLPTEEEMNEALAKRHGAALANCFSKATVAICGLGGLGSCIAVALARSGIGNLLLYDFDVVDVSNLHRQQYKLSQIGMPKAQALSENLAEFAPYTHIQAHVVRLTSDNAIDFLSKADVICEAFDDAKAKAMLTNLVLEQLPKTDYIAASGMAGLGSPNDIHTKQIATHFYLCGDEKSDVDEVGSLFAPRAMLCAAHEAQTVLRILAHQNGLI